MANLTTAQVGAALARVATITADRLPTQGDSAPADELRAIAAELAPDQAPAPDPVA